jgi:ATP-binding cassette subfamily B protein
VLVLDDALSAVNPAREVEILGTIRAHAPTTAVLCITRRPGPQTLADQVVELPPAGSHRAVAAPGEIEAPEVSAFAALANDEVYDPRLLEIISNIKLSGDDPQLPEAAAVDTAKPPSLRALLVPQKRLVVEAVLALLFVTGVGLVPDLVFGDAIDRVKANNTAATDRLALGLIVVAICIGAGQFVFRITSAKVNQGALYGLRRRVFERLSKLGIEYYDRELPGQVSAKVVHDIDRIARFLGTGFGEPGMYQLVSKGALFLGALGIIALLSFQVALVVLPFALVLALLTRVQMPIADRAYAVGRLRLGTVVARLQEDFAGRYVIKAFGAERRARIDFETDARELRTARRRAETVSNTYLALINLVLAVAGAAIYWRAGSLALAGALTLGTVVTLRLYVENVLQPVRTLGRLWPEYLQARVSLRQLATPFEVPILPVEAAVPTPCPRLRGALAFEGASFTYPGTARPVIHGLSFKVEPGSIVAVVGYTGAGKSSVAKLLGRIYDPTGGRVLVDGLDLRDLDLTSYRRRLGIVPQDAFLFRGTVQSNIAYGRPEATLDEVRAAAEGVGALATLLELEGRFGATVEEEGRNLTAAERQLIALARMWLVEPDILVLDEATASLDAETEASVLDAVCRLGRTTLLITHRLAVAERADEVVVIDAGRLVERGRHEDLLAAGGAYASLWTWTGQVPVEEPDPVA